MTDHDDTVACPICMQSLSSHPDGMQLLSTDVQTDQPFNCLRHRGHLQCVSQYYATFCHRSCPYRCVSRCQSDERKCTICRRTDESGLPIVDFHIQTVTTSLRLGIIRILAAHWGLPAHLHSEYFAYLEQYDNESDVEYVVRLTAEIGPGWSMLLENTL